MIYVYIATIVLLYIILIIGVRFRPNRPKLSFFESKRRAKQKNKKAFDEYDRYLYVDSAMTVVILINIFVSFAFLVVSIVGFGTVIGLTIYIIGLIVLMFIVKNVHLSTSSSKIHQSFERKLFQLAEKYNKYLSKLSITEWWSRENPDVQSNEEFMDIMTKSKSALSSQLYDRFKASAKNEHIVANEIATPIDDITVLHEDDLMGPLALNDLHKTDRDTFPVVYKAKKTEEVAGIVSISHLKTLKDKTSYKARECMDGEFLRISGDESIYECIYKMIEANRFSAVVYKRDKAIGMIDLDYCVKRVLGEDK